MRGSATHGSVACVVPSGQSFRACAGRCSRLPRRSKIAAVFSRVRRARGFCRVGAPSASRACAAAFVALRWGESGRAPGYGAVGSAPALGAGGRGFKSRYPDRRLGDGGRHSSSFFLLTFLPKIRRGMFDGG